MTGRRTDGGTLKLRQVRSGIGYEASQKATLKALGLGKIGSERVHTDNPQVRGMVAKIAHLVVIVDGEEQSR